MNHHEASLRATFKTTADFGAKYAADFPPTGIAGQQFALIANAVTQSDALGATQVSGSGQKHSGVISKAAARAQLHDDLVAINRAAHSLTLLGTAGLQGKFALSHNNSDQALLNTANAFATDAAPLTAQMTSVGLTSDFLARLSTDIATFQAAASTKTAGAGVQAGATGALADAMHKAAIALHVLQSIVPNVYKNDAAKLAEWATASHVQKHTPVPHPQPASATAATATPAKT